MKILFIRFSSIGDLVLATPVFRCTKRQLPDSEIHLVTKKKFADVTASNPFIDKFHYYEEDLESLIGQLKQESFDAVIDLHNNFRSNKIKHALEKKSYTINKLNFQKFILTKLKVDVMPGRHITTRCLDTVKPLGVKDDGGGLDFFIPQQQRLNENDIPHSHLAGYIAIVIGANHFTKKLPVHKLKELCSKIDFPVILVGGPSEKDAGLEIASIDDIKIYNACGKFNLYESADIVRRARMVISHDTGLQYIACAFNKPLIAIWGGTSPLLDVEPYYPKNLSHLQPPVFENVFLNLWCQPCSKYGLPRCPLGHFKCMEKQNTTYIARRAIEMVHQFPMTV